MFLERDYVNVNYFLSQTPSMASAPPRPVHTEDINEIIVQMEMKKFKQILMSQENAKNMLLNLDVSRTYPLCKQRATASELATSETAAQKSQRADLPQNMMWKFGNSLKRPPGNKLPPVERHWQRQSKASQTKTPRADVSHRNDSLLSDINQKLGDSVSGHFRNRDLQLGSQRSQERRPKEKSQNLDDLAALDIIRENTSLLSRYNPTEEAEDLTGISKSFDVFAPNICKSDVDAIDSLEGGSLAKGSLALFSRALNKKIHKYQTSKMRKS